MKQSALRQPDGFGLLELMVTLVIVSLLMVLAVPAYDGFITRAKIAGSIGDLGSIAIEIEIFSLHNNDQFPFVLTDLPMDIPLDPWGNAYQYMNIRAAGPGNGAFRKDGNLNPLNTDFDLFSQGADGDSMGPLSAMASRDDIVRANNGAFYGLAADY